MHGPTGIFWANLTPFSLKENSLCELDKARVQIVQTSAEKMKELRMKCIEALRGARPDCAEQVQRLSCIMLHVLRRGTYL